ADDGQNRTMRSGHHLDVDGRYQKVRRVGFRILRSMIQMCLRRHHKVVVWNIIGNHDDYSAVDLSLWLQVAYENEPRVHIETSANKFYYLQFGKVMLAATHGDTVRQEQMLGIMAADQPAMWGQCQYRYAHMGHVHHTVQIRPHGPRPPQVASGSSRRLGRDPPGSAALGSLGSQCRLS
ncbi:MAG: hypothetical protein EBZ61_10840, partial [Micrococcales bacterium]|nr:hypothetical protein [Micrococcales bacterium]